MATKSTKSHERVGELVVDVMVIGGVVSLNVGAFLLAAWVGFVAAGVTGIAAGGLLYWWPRRSGQKAEGRKQWD